VEKLFAAEPTSAKELPMTSLRRRMTEDMQVRNLSPHTQDSYVQQVSLFARHFRKSPEVLGPEEIRSYQVYLTNEKKLAPSSILIAVAALRFLYKVTLHKDWRSQTTFPPLRNDAQVVTDSGSIEIPAALKSAIRCITLHGKQVSPHVLRHSCAMIVLQATQDIRKVSLWLGHSNLTTTEVYVRADPTKKLEAIEAVVPPSLRKGKFRPPDKLLALLKGKS
jgi:site-specific recombinase XerD